MHRDDFEILRSGIIYFDNGATTLKPKQVVNAISDYYTKYTANAHRGDYDNSLKVDNLYEGVREKVKNFINADKSSEIIFTKGATESLNMVVFGFMQYNLRPGDEVILTKSEHASNVLPWMELAKKIGIVIKYAPLDSNHSLTLEALESVLSSKTKVISIAHVTNTVGDIRPIKEIGDFCKKYNIYFVVDGAQSVPHIKTDVKDLNIDFLAFSFHKMLGPTGCGVLYGKYDLLDKLVPLNFGGGMNNFFEADGSLEYKSLPTRLEAGTPNIAGVIGSGAAIDYINDIGIDVIEKYLEDLREYLIKQLSTISNVNIYNKNAKSTTVIFNLKDIFAQDTSIYLNTYHICVRAGNHCAKILKDEIGVRNTCRITLYLYNTKEEIDMLVKVLRNSKDIFKVVI